MGHAASIDSMKSYEDEVSNLGETPLDKAELDQVFGAAIGNMRLFDLLKDDVTGKIYPSDLREMVKARRRVAENRRNASIVRNEGVGGKQKASLVQELANTESDLKKITTEKAQFQQTMCEASTSGRPISDAIVKENAAKLAEYTRVEESLKKEHKEAHDTLLGLRREEVSKAAKDRAERTAQIHKQIEGKTGFAFINAKSGGGGGGGGSTIMFSPANTYTDNQPLPMAGTLKRRTFTMAREGDEAENN
mmetsp:Transcript_28075/g.36279  ORF Transcript_28075/g.36279 Transcript_28075/m.36279 type:complete len:249 (+) Transcript_28075:113-859(+)